MWPCFLLALSLASEVSLNDLRLERGQVGAGCSGKEGGPQSHTEQLSPLCRFGSRTVGRSGASGRRRVHRPILRGCPSRGHCQPPTRSAPTWTPAPSPRTTRHWTQPGQPLPLLLPQPSRAYLRLQARPACRPAGRLWA